MTRRGLDFCPATLASAILLEEADTEKPDTLAPGEWETIAMKPIPDRHGRSGVFGVGRRDDGGLGLGSSWADPDIGWPLGSRIAFRPRK